MTKVAIPTHARLDQLLHVDGKFARITQADLNAGSMPLARFAPPPRPGMVPVPTNAVVGQTMWLALPGKGEMHTILSAADVATGWVEKARFMAGAITASTNASAARAIYGDTGACPVNDPVDVRPLHQGTHGRWWRVNLHDLRLRYTPGKADAGVAMYIVEAPWAHPAWHSYVASLIHLREVPGMGPADIAQPGATHQLNLWAMDPKHPRQPMLRGRANPMAAHMTPQNFAAQFDATQLHLGLGAAPAAGTATWVAWVDQLARQKVESALGEVCAGTLTPDADGVHDWALRFGDNLLKPGSKLQ